MRRGRARRTGFTLIELMLVVGIMVLLAGVAVIAYPRIMNSMHKGTAETLVKQVAGQVEMFQVAMRRFPTEDKGLQELVTVPDDEAQAKLWKDGSGPFLKDGMVPKDPWGNELKYKNLESSSAGGTGPAFLVYSCGPDGQDGTEDDIKSSIDQTAN